MNLGELRKIINNPDLSDKLPIKCKYFVSTGTRPEYEDGYEVEKDITSAKEQQLNKQECIFVLS